MTPNDRRNDMGPRERLLSDVHALTPARTPQGERDRAAAVERWLDTRGLTQGSRSIGRHRSVTRWAAGLAAALVAGIGLQLMRAPGADEASATRASHKVQSSGEAQPRASATRARNAAGPPYDASSISRRPAISDVAAASSIPALPPEAADAAPASRPRSNVPARLPLDLAASDDAAPHAHVREERAGSLVATFDRLATSAQPHAEVPATEADSPASSTSPVAHATLQEPAPTRTHSDAAAANDSTQICVECEEPPSLLSEGAASVAPARRSLPLTSPVEIGPVSPLELEELQSSGANDIARFLPSLEFDALDPCIESKEMSAAVEPEDPENQTYVDGRCRGL